jgi:hypothetical protein
MKKRKFIFLIEGKNNAWFELKSTNILECGDSSPLWDFGSDKRLS